MADRAISELTAATKVAPSDLFVLEQSGTAKKLTGQILENWLLSFANGHGGIQSIVKHSTSGLNNTYRITLSDATTFDFVVKDGDVGERGMSFYRVNSAKVGSAEYYGFTDFLVPHGFTPSVNDLVLYNDGNLGYIQEVNMDSQIAKVTWLGFDLLGPAGRNGVDGKNGTDGVSVTHSWNGTSLVITSASGTSSADLKGEAGDNGNGIKAAKLNEDYTLTLTFDDGTTYTTPGIRGAKGEPGKDGQSVYHTFEGNRLTITSASGTSHIDLAVVSKNSIDLQDIVTGAWYKLYIANGKIMAHDSCTVNVQATDCTIKSNGLNYDCDAELYVIPGDRLEIILTLTNYATQIDSVGIYDSDINAVEDYVFTETETGGKIVIPVVSDNLSVEVYTSKAERTVSMHLNNCGGESSGYVTNGESFEYGIVADEGYNLAFVSVYMGDEDITDTAVRWDGNRADVFIEHVTADVSISAEAMEE